MSAPSRYAYTTRAAYAAARALLNMRAGRAYWCGEWPAAARCVRVRFSTTHWMIDTVR